MISGHTMSHCIFFPPFIFQFASGVDSSELKSMRESVSSWTASTPEDQEGMGGATRGLIGPQRPGPSASGIGPSIGPSFKVRIDGY